MARVKSLDEIKAKWERVTPGRLEDYRLGVTSPRESWEQKTKAAEGNFEMGIQQAIAEKRFGKGVAAAGDPKWQKGALEKGTVRWPAGVAGAGEDYMRGFAPIHQAISSVNLPPRGPKGDPRNLERVKAMNLAVSKAARASR